MSNKGISKTQALSMIGEKIENEQVSLIASSYEWICPNCNHFNTIVATTEHVTCSLCKRKFETLETQHAYD